MEIKTIEIAGLAGALTALRLPYGKKVRSIIEGDMKGYMAKSNLTGEKTHLIVWNGSVDINNKDLALMQTLIQRGDEHAKPLRGIIAYADITAPICFWWDLETYTAGHQRLFSESTMHTEGKGLSGHALQAALHSIHFDRLVRKVDFFSYQCLRNIVIQRFDHRKVEFHRFIDWIKTLPLAEELILVGLEDKIAVHDEYMRKYNAEEI